MLPNVVLTPHIGGASPDTVQRHAAMLLEDLERFLKGQCPVHMANPEVWQVRH